MKITISTTIASMLVLGSAGASAQTTTARVGDVTSLQGQGVNAIVGYGLVTGLDGTGDGGNYVPTMEALMAMMERFGVVVESLDDVRNAKNVAIVAIEVIIPDHGIREGETLDVAVTALAAKSLRGGRLLSTPLIYHDRNIKELFAFARGPISIEGRVQTSGTIRGGARMERDVLTSVIATGSQLKATGFTHSWIRSGSTYLTLVLDGPHAGWSMAAAVAQAVDKELGISAAVDRVALAMDSKNIVVLLPEHQRGDAASWIRDVERTPLLMESNEARVTINRGTGTIVVTGDTRLSPVVISQLGMTVTVATPLPDGTIPKPAFQQHDFVALDIEKDRSANVRDLLEALNQLRVPFVDRVAVLEQIHRAGKLHAKILYEG